MPQYVITEIPFNLHLQMPIYAPVPLCRGTNEDLNYKVVGLMPSWISFKEKTREVTISPYSDRIQNGVYSVKIGVHYM